MKRGKSYRVICRKCKKNCAARFAIPDDLLSAIFPRLHKNIDKQICDGSYWECSRN